MDVGARDFKKKKIKARGSDAVEIVDHDEAGNPITSYNQALNMVHELAQKNPGKYLAIPHADPYVVAGYATAALETIAQLKNHGINLDQPGQMLKTALLVATGSGGLLAGWLEMK